MNCINKTLEQYIKNEYSVFDIRNLFTFLVSQKTFLFKKYETGLYPAAFISEKNEYTGYQNVWIRDNFYVAYAHLVIGDTKVAVDVAKGITKYLLKYQYKFEEIVNGKLNYKNSMNRPHIRFNGEKLEEINVNWPHAQNDALGYYLFLVCRLANFKNIEITKSEIGLFVLLIKYFNKIKFWKDKDNGHWEETKKVEASSIGVVVSALIDLKILAKNEGITEIYIISKLLDKLIIKGQKALNKLLPSESNKRKYDAALLFLIFPMKIVSEKIENKILENITENLQGDFGVKRYLGDSFWCTNYKSFLKPENRTTTHISIKERNKLVKPGEEAQWCIFDPILSIINGLKYRKTKDENYLKKQIEYFNRSICQITGDNCELGSFKCSELYYLENGNYVPNDVVPLYWSQANLMMAFKFMEDSVKKITT